MAVKDNRLPVMDFDGMVNEITRRSTSAQATFLFRLINKLGPALCRSVIKYACMRLDEINKVLPENSPYRQFYEKLRKERESTLEITMPSETLEKW